ncbi:MAG: methyltransferase domain-containing protein [Candidatus Binatia bacterium]
MDHPHFQLGFSAQHRAAMYDAGARTMKASKVLAILEDYLGSLAGLDHLDIGCSTGFLTLQYGARFASSTGIDIDEAAVDYARRHHCRDNIQFMVGDGARTGLPEASFDVVTCTHIYEHVPDARQLMAEIHRVLKPGGICFFAAGNRFNWIEGHYHLPLLAAVPKPLGHAYLRLAGKGNYYYETHLSYWGLRRLVRAFDVIDYTLKVIQDPIRFSATDSVAPGSVKQRLGLRVLRLAYWLSPTYLWLLRKTRESARVHA